MKTISAPPLLFFLMLLAIVPRSSGADDKHSSYSVVCDAKQAGSQILFKCVITKEAADGKLQVLSRPYVSISDGRSAEVTIGRGGDSGAGAKTATQSAGTFSAVQITVVKALGSDKVVYIVTVMENDAIIWAQTGSANVAAASGPTTRPNN
jgi:hypothetical protein